MPLVLILLSILLTALAPMRVAAQSQPVVVELFTSQGCSSCPPADAYLAELAERDDVLPLALHVDYWDRLGWRDTFASEAFTRRQYAYARTFGNRSVWTPQFVVQGTHYSRGDFRSMIDDRVAEHRARGPAYDVKVSEEGDMLNVSTRPLSANAPEAKVIVVHYTKAEQVKIKRGENAGRTITYHNVVRAWRVIGRNARGASAEFDVPMELGRPVAVLVQAPKTGEILAAQVLR